MELLPFDPLLAASWDAFCAEASQATLLHTRRFLSYHGDRFHDESMLILEGGKVIGVLPAARSPHDPTHVSSHPGASYGGMVHAGGLLGERALLALSMLRCHYARRGYARLLYKAVPAFYQRGAAQDDLYALFRMGARRVRCDLSSTIDLTFRRRPSERRRRGLKKARAAVHVHDGTDALSELWPVVEGNLQREHGVRPVHSVAEMRELCARFPLEIRVRCARINGRVEAGVVLFNTPTVWHAQYIAASPLARTVSALDAVFESLIDDATAAGARWFDFGISTEDDGRRLNASLYDYKSQYGGGGFVHEFYELPLADEPA